MNNDMLNAKNEKKNLREYMSDSNTLISFLLTLLAVLAPTFRGSDFLKQLIQLNIDGLLLYQAIFAFLALVAAFAILFTVNRLVSHAKVRNTWRRYGYYVFVFAMLGALSLSLREFYAPSSSLSNYFLEKEERINYASVQVEAGLEIELEYCSRSGSQVTCNLDVRNVSNEDLEVSGVGDTRIFDQENTKAELERIHVANEFIRSYQKISLTKKSSTSLKLFFKYPTESNPTLIKKLSFNLDYSEGRRALAFRNIAITNSI